MSADPQTLAAPLRLAQPDEQLRYALWLERSTRAGLVLLCLGFLLYTTGWVAPHVPLAQLPSLWQLPSDAYLQAIGVGPGWGWIGLVGRSDLLNLAGIAALTASSLLCLLGALPVYLQRGDRAYVLLCGAEVAVLLLAASGAWLPGH